MSTDSPTDPAEPNEEPGPDEQGRLYAHQLYPEPVADFDDLDADDVRRYQVARALGFYFGTEESVGGVARWVGEGKDRTFNPVWVEATTYALAELRTAALLVLDGDRDAVAKQMWHFGWAGELSEVVYDSAAALGIDVHKIRPYVDEPAS